MKIDFQFETEHGVFSDALHLPDDHGLSGDKLEALKQQRLANWLSAVTAAPQEDPPQE